MEICGRAVHSITSKRKHRGRIRSLTQACFVNVKCVDSLCDVLWEMIYNEERSLKGERESLGELEDLQ